MNPSGIRFVLRFYEDDVEYGEGVLPAMAITASEEDGAAKVITLGEVEEFVKTHRNGFTDAEDYSILADSTHVHCDEDLERLVSEAVAKEVKEVVLHVVSTKSDWELVDTASQMSKTGSLAVSEQEKSLQEEEQEAGAEKVKVEPEEEELEVEDKMAEQDGNEEMKDVEQDGNEEVKEPVQDGNEKATEEVQEPVQDCNEEAEKPVQDGNEEVKESMQPGEVSNNEVKEPVQEVEKEAEAAERDEVETLKKDEELVREQGELPVKERVDAEKKGDAKEGVDAEKKGDTKMASDGYFVDSEPSLNLDMLDECWSRSTFNMSKHCLPKESVSNASEAPSFLKVENSSVGLSEPVELQELISLLTGVAEELLQSDAIAASAKLSDFLSNTTLTTTVAQLAADEAVVESVQHALSSDAVKNLVLDLGRNEVTTWAQLKETVNTHLGDLFAVFGDVLKQSPQLVAIIPHCLKLLTGFLDAETRDAATETEAAPDRGLSAVHPGILCDGCDDAERKEAAVEKGVNVGGYIKGIRYKSAVKVNYDLCESCEASGDFDEEYGPFLKIKTPEKAPKEILCVLDHAQPPSRRAQGTQARSAESREERVLFCPKKGHALCSFTVPNRLYACDVCDCRPQRGSIMHGCRQCDWDICDSCMKSQHHNFTSAVVEPQTGATASPAPAEPKMTVVSPSTGRPRMAFVKDLNLMDGSVVRATTEFTKLWRVRNSSNSITWPAGCRLVCVGGDIMGAASSGYLVPPLPPKEALDVVVKFVAPKKPGRYLSYWRLITPMNERFGQRLWIDVVVEGTGWEKELAFLADMDFSQSERNKELLQEYDGDVERVLAVLLEEQKKA